MNDPSGAPSDQAGQHLELVWSRPESTELTWTDVVAELLDELVTSIPEDAA